MRKINLRIAELRKNKNVTQQEVADAIGVSFQTISKWETESSMPDITLLPVLADYFQVTVDQLLGLVPLNEEKYLPSQMDTNEFWNKKLDYLLRIIPELILHIICWNRARFCLKGKELRQDLCARIFMIINRQKNTIL